MGAANNMKCTEETLKKKLKRIQCNDMTHQCQAKIALKIKEYMFSYTVRKKYECISCLSI